jgi:hypothetical protein
MPFLDRAAIAAAAIRACHGCRRRAHEYKRWAFEAEAKADIENYRKWRAESDRQWKRAWQQLNTARAYHA